MNKANNSNSIDETREAIVAKIEQKNVSTAKIVSKIDSLAEMNLTYEQAIVNHEKKITALRAKIGVYTDSIESNRVDLEKRQNELVQMNVVLERYDEASQEGAELSVYLLEKINTHEWHPGDDQKKSTARLDEDPEYQQARKRKLEINDVTGSALGEVNRIFFGRTD